MTNVLNRKAPLRVRVSLIFPYLTIALFIITVNTAIYLLFILCYSENIQSLLQYR